MLKTKWVNWTFGVALMFLVIYGADKWLGIDGKEESIQATVKDNYMNEQGLIHAYPKQQKSQYLSESIGLYMQYLVLVHDRNTFEQQVEQLQDYFIVRKNGDLYIQWELDEASNVNALIDDLRIIGALQSASKGFKEPTYETLAKKLASSIQKNQTPDGYYVDFYDWSTDSPASRVTLSYLTPEFFATFSNNHGTKQLLESLDGSLIFFPEFFDTKSGTFSYGEEVHLIDQLLIALNRENIDQPSPSFEEWVTTEWRNQGKLYGRYNRETKEATVNYESLSVYYFLQQYFREINENDLANEVVKHAQQLADESTIDKAHFFDYIHYQQMLEEND